MVRSLKYTALLGIMLLCSVYFLQAAHSEELKGLSRNSLVNSDLSDPTWDYTAGYNGQYKLETLVLENYSEGATFYHLNPNANAPGWGQKTTAFAAPQGVSNIEVSFEAQVLSGTKKLEILICDVGVTTLYGRNSFTLDTNLREFAASFAVNPGEYSVVIGIGGWPPTNASCIIGNFRLTPELSPAIDQVFSGDFLRLEPRGNMLDSIDGKTFPRNFTQSPFGRLVFRTDASRMVLERTSSLYYGGFTRLCSLGVYIDGQPYQIVKSTLLNKLEQTGLDLPHGDKLVEIVLGSQAASGQADKPAGTYIRAVYLPSDGNTAAGNLPTKRRRMVVYGDSISVGDSATSPTFEGWPIIVRNDFAGSVRVEAWGSRQLYHDNALGLDALAEKLCYQNPSEIWLAIGTNDWYPGLWSAADFGSAYAVLLDKIHTALPNAKIWCQTPILRGNPETAINSLGLKLNDYREAIAAAVSTRTGFAILVNGTAILPYDTLNFADGTHPTTLGHQRYGNYVLDLLNTRPFLDVSIDPAAAVAAGAGWRVDNGPWNDGLTGQIVSPGAHTVSFKPLPGWLKPSDRNVSAQEGETSYIAVNYARNEAMPAILLLLQGE